MTDLEQALRRAIGSPPEDDEARQRALIRLRAEIEGENARQSEVRRRPALIRALTMVICLILVLAIAVAISSRQPAVATELEALAQANAAWEADHDMRPLKLDERYLKVGTSLDGGQGYTILIHAEVTRSVADDGDPIEVKRILSVDFPSETDREIWVSIQAPGKEDLKAGTVTTQPLSHIYNLDAVSTDPTVLKQALEEGRVTASGYVPAPGQTFGLIGSLLTQPGLSPEQRNALYQVIGAMDGVEFVGDMIDPAGRPGVGFSRTSGTRSQILVFDPATGLPLAALETPADEESPVLESLVFDPPD